MIARLYHYCFYRLAQTLVRIIFGCTTRVRISGRGHLPKRGAFLLICNHISHFDPPLLAAVQWRHVSWVVALEMFQHPVGKFFFEGIDSIPIDRVGADRKAVKEILRRLKAGRPVGIFPEGGIRSGATSVLGGAPLDESVGAMAQLAGVPVVPCVMLGTDKLYAKRAWRWRTTIDIRFGAPIELASNLENRLVREKMSRDALEALLGLARELREEHQLTDNDFPKTAQERWSEADLAGKSAHSV